MNDIAASFLGLDGNSTDRIDLLARQAAIQPASELVL